MIRLIAAVDEHRGMADDRGIPWQGKLPSDAKYFRDQTSEGAILMGYRTYEEFSRPLHDRPNFVLTRPGSGLRPGFVAVEDLDGFFSGCGDDVAWVIGGEALYQASIEHADQLYVTQLEADFHCTKFFPEFADRFVRSSESALQGENGIPFRFQVWERAAGPT